MTSSDDNNELVPEDLYNRSYADLAQLQTQLPEEAVVSLAREVLARLAKRLKEPPSIPEKVETLTSALIGPEPRTAASFIEEQINEGMDVETLYLTYIAESARKLGEWWETDQITFAQVTVGIGRIYAIMRTISHRIAPIKIPDKRGAFFAAVPGDNHTLGVKMAADLARKDGWDIELALDQDHDDLVENITTLNPLLIGLSAAGNHALPNLAKLVLALRISVPNALIVVSGNIASVASDSVKLMHVDGLSPEYDEAMDQLDALWEALQDGNAK